MKTASTADRLKQIMRERNLRQVDILAKCQPYAERLNVKFGRNDLSQYVSGKVQPSQTKLTVLGLALGVNEVWLMGYDVPIERTVTDLFHYDNIQPITRKKFPMLGDIACGKPIFANEDRESYVMAGTNIDADFCLTCRGDSMIGARIHDGDIVFIHRQSMINNGEIAAVIIENSATLKRVYYYPEQGKLILQAENSKYAPLVYLGEELNEIQILGKAIAFQSDVV